MENVILVDVNDTEIGVMEKLEAHRLGKLHRAFSFLIFNSAGELMLQRRARTKYHSGGLWTNTCCSHPQPGEQTSVAARRKLKHEMGIDVEPTFMFKFKYNVRVDNNLVEHEIDHVFTGTYDGIPDLNQEEAEDWRFASLYSIREEIKKKPEQFTVWFKLIIKALPERAHR